ncbi:glycosyltransferase [Treponema zuelzerae]|uniref:Glycosyltransferase n=1 Tax=Teretinema zuelzerae TaxID=156 RepID=A0AAE3EFH1_9SPIR|nr:glycosyltransferase [Teretinema zuelzerae]MCD1653160.1 glycosyltransferase [Teretinema zuelzerae]
MNAGGAERVIANVANILSCNHQITLKVLYKNKMGSFYTISNNIAIKYITNVEPPLKDEISYNIRLSNFIKLLKLYLYYIKVLIQKYLKSILYIIKEDSDIIISDRIFFSKLFSCFAPQKVIKIGQEHNHHNDDIRYIKKVIKACRNIDYLMPASQSLSDYYSKIILKTKIKYIPHSLSYFPSNRASLINKQFLTVGRLVQGKGVDDLIDLFYVITQIDNECKLVIIGDGPDKKRLLEKVDFYKLKEHIIFTGNLDYQKVCDYYFSSSLYLSCSWTESFGLTFLEAASFGLPSICYDSAQGASEIIRDSVDGFLIPNRNQSEYISKVLLLLNNYDLRVSFGCQAYNKANNYTEDKVKLMWYDFIKELECKLNDIL